jgi:ATP adenylyltransferase
MPYILKEGPKSDGCFFCDGAVDRERFRENLVLVVQEHSLVLLNKFPFTTSHLLVAPRRHVADLADLTDAEYTELTTLLRETTIRLRRAVKCTGINIGFNLGVDAGAGVADHLHGHAVPRWRGDANFMPVIADVRVMPEYLDEAWRRLYPEFVDLPGERAPAPAAP